MSGLMSCRMMASPSATPVSSSPPESSPSSVARMPIPGSYGWPIIGPLSDRLNYAWFQGPEKFFKTRIEKFNSKVFRTNLPPTFPFFLKVNPNVVALLDVKSFSYLFDMEIVEKSDVLVGDSMPSVKFTGGTRVCAYLDTSEPRHTQVKNLASSMLRQSSSIWVPSMESSLDTLWDSTESKLSTSSNGVSYYLPIAKFLFTFLSRTLLRADPSSTPVVSKYGHLIISVWLALQIVPSTVINTFQPLPEILLHSFTYPFWLISFGYQKLSDFVKSQAKEILSHAQSEFNLTEEETIHDLLFILGFNAFGGFVLFFFSLINALGDNQNLHEKLRKEARQTLAKNNNTMSFESVKQMELINSFVYETLRLNPPVPLQYARARKDFDLETEGRVFAIKKGELLCGYQPLVMKDSAVFENPEEFVYDRFTRERGGEELLMYLYWSNGPQRGGDGPSAANKQCPARDVVPMTAALFLADLFRRYDDITISSGRITSLQKAK
ncbi:fatty acid hydroperoxide lyase, chloroplastic [Primulina huaijiensis]|uniref:fatty acid hydroperoxide lyase, chloroplastic n=1 Tax=Primulina huaijiensis TaxID=1492673 RepID=UPI003CC6FC21